MNQNISNLNLSKGSIPPLLKYKIVFLGDQAVGKSSIINRFIYDLFDGGEHRPTIGIDFISQNIFLEDRTIRLQLWDTAGQQRFRSLIPNYIRDSSAAIIVYDITSKISFNSVQKWIDDIKHQRGQDIIMAIIANKLDLQQSRLITKKQGEQFARDNKAIFWQVSAKTGQGIHEFFKQLVNHLPNFDQNCYTKRQQRGNTSKEVSINQQRKKQIRLNQKQIIKKTSKRNCC